MLLCNFSNTDYHLDFFKNRWNGLKTFIKEEKFDGIELLLHGNDDISEIPNDLVKGLHLSYFPTWLDFYKNDEAYKIDYPTLEDLESAFGGSTSIAIVERFKKDFEIAKKLDVKYMVFHVGHVTTKDAFTLDYHYSNRDVLKHTADLVNEIFEDSKIMLLFENLWWPGLTLTDKDDLSYFMDLVNYKNKGVLLDLSHLLLTNDKLNNLDEGLEYIKEVLARLGDLKDYIKGVHLNATEGYSYLRQNHLHKYEEYLQAGRMDRYKIIYEHISSMDQHKAFCHYGIQEVLELIDPSFINIEVKSNSFLEWSDTLRLQKRYL